MLVCVLLHLLAKYQKMAYKKKKSVKPAQWCLGYACIMGRGWCHCPPGFGLGLLSTVHPAIMLSRLEIGLQAGRAWYKQNIGVGDWYVPKGVA